jgi:hypothetical protein
MNLLYIIIPVVVISLVALMFIKPKLYVLNKKHTRFIRKANPVIKADDLTIDRTNVNITEHPPIITGMP